MSHEDTDPRAGSRPGGPLRYQQQIEALERVAGGFAHDFNNILAAILGSAELALEAGVDPDVRGDLEMIVSSAKRGMGIVERLLGFSRHRTLDRRAYAISDLVRRAEPMLRERVPPNVQLSVDCPCDHLVLADAPAIQQLLLNLVLSAAHEMQRGGSIRIGCRPARSDADPADREREVAPSGAPPGVELIVRDDGPGERHGLDSLLVGGGVPARSSSVDAMGMALAYAIVEEHGGTMDVRRVPGQGTTVRCVFHVHEPAPRVTLG